MGAPSSELRALLVAQGFRPPEPWVEYARRRGLRRVPAERLRACPDCGSRRAEALGQYVHYSHLATLRECGACGLVYSDLRLPDEVTASHFEVSYKDDGYFLRQRSGVIRQLAAMVVDRAPPGGRVLDVGAATGHLMRAVRRQRPDLDLTLSDISEAACRAGERSGFRVLRSDIPGLESLHERFDVLVMSDVIYFERAIDRLWRVLPRLVAGEGTLILRVPNKLAWIRLYQRSLQALAPSRAATADRIRFFNPEHLFVFPPRLLRARLRGIGFSEVSTAPARSLRPGGTVGLAGELADGAAWAIHRTIPGRPVVSPSLVMTARRDASA